MRSGVPDAYLPIVPGAMRELYEHTQRGWFGIPALLVCAVIAAVVVANDDISTEWLLFSLAIIVLVLILMVLFSRLKVVAEEERLVASFTLGRPHRVVEFDKVRAVRRVRNRWWHGWGIRWIPGGSMYNVWGFDAVEFEFVAGGVFRVGTDEPDELLAVVSPRVGSSGDSGSDAAI
jgi:hypothetical protein